MHVKKNGSFTNYVYKKREVGVGLFVNVHNVENVNGGG